MSESKDHGYWLLFGLLLAILITLGIFLSSPVPDAASGATHPTFPSMSEGGTSERHEGRLWLGWIYGSLQIVLYTFCVFFVVSKAKSGRVWILISGVIYLSVFAALILNYRNGLENASFSLGFPFPTSLLIFGMWPVAALFALLYVVGYSSWIYSLDDARRFEALKKRYAETEEAKE